MKEDDGGEDGSGEGCGKWYWFDSAGWMRTGWLNDGGRWYWFEGGGVMQTGWQRIGGSWYHFNSSGAMATSQWIGSSYVGADGKWIPNYRATPNPASDFEWEVGDYCLDGVGTGSLEQALKSGGYTVEGRYGNAIAWSLPSVGGSIAKDCGHGVYITGYKGSDGTVVVPEKINGVDVVYVDVNELGEGGVETVDVSQCRQLRSLDAGCPSSINFGSISSVEFIWIQSAHGISYLDLSCLDKLTYFECQGHVPQSFSLNTKSLMHFGGLGASSLNFSGASNLCSVRALFGSLTESTLNLSGCTNLESLKLDGNTISSFDPSRFPKLTYLELTDNPLTSAAKTKLATWGNQPGHDLYL